MGSPQAGDLADYTLTPLPLRHASIRLSAAVKEPTSCYLFRAVRVPRGAPRKLLTSQAPYSAAGGVCLMKQVFRRVIDRRGRVSVLELPVPHLGPDQVLVQGHYSLISSGTELGTLSKTPTELVRQ